MGVQSTRTTRAYWRDIIVVVTAKAAALALLYGLFFAAPQSAPSPADHLFQQGAPR
jgi:anti-sigma-K factor RskA